MFGKKKWLAIVRDQQWTLAKVSYNKGKLSVLRFSTINLKLEDKPVIQDLVLVENPFEAETISVEKKNLPEPSLRLKNWFRQQRVPLEKLRVAFSCPGVITRIIVLPKMSAKDLNKLLTEHADQYFTLNIEDYLVDYRVLEHFAEEGQNRQRVLLAALPKYHWEAFLDTCQRAGYRPKVVDLAADSVTRLYAQLDYKKGSKGGNKTGSPFDCAIVDLCRGRVEFILLEHGVFFLFSDMEVSLESLAESFSEAAVLAAEKDIKQREMSALEMPGFIGEETLTLAQTAAVNHSELGHDLRSELEAALTPVFRTLGEFFNFFAARHFGKSVEQIFITGDLADLPYLEELFTENLGVETKVGFPKGWRPRFKKRFLPYQKGWMKYASLYGLAFRED
ncbi:MAG: pilus assembly protein PilM [Desulfitobacteriaceae bacterium]